MSKSNNKWRNILHWGRDISKVRAPGLWLYPNENSIHFRISTKKNFNSGVDAKKLDKSGVIWDEWFHYAVVVSGMDVRHYINGKLHNSGKLSELPISPGKENLHIPDTIGRHMRGVFIKELIWFNTSVPASDISKYMSYLKNRKDWECYYDRYSDLKSLPKNRITMENHYNRIGKKENRIWDCNPIKMLYRWNFIDGGRNIIKSIVGKLNGQATNVGRTSGINGVAVSFNGIGKSASNTSSHISLSTVNLANVRTISMWVYFNKFNNSSKVMDFGNGAGKRNVSIGNKGTVGDLLFEIYHKNVSKKLVIKNFWSVNKWQHVVFTAGDKMIGWKNGKMMGEEKGWVPDNFNLVKNYFGRSNWGSHEILDGKISDVRFYDDTLDKDKIQVLYEEGEKNIKIIRKGLTAYIYKVKPTKRRKHVQFKELIKKVVTPGIKVPSEIGRKSSNIGIRWIGYLTAPKDGVYRFWFKTSNGSRLWIDYKIYAESHGQQMAYYGGKSITMKGGKSYNIRYEWYNANSSGVELWWQPPSEGKQMVPTSVLTTRNIGSLGKIGTLKKERKVIIDDVKELNKMQYVVEGKNIPFGRGDEYTVMLWIKASANNNNWRNIFRWGNSEISLYPNEKHIRFKISTKTGVEGVDVKNLDKIPEWGWDKWFHYTVIVKGREIRHYINGKIHSSGKTRKYPISLRDHKLYVPVSTSRHMKGVFIKKFSLFNYPIDSNKIPIYMKEGDSSTKTKTGRYVRLRQTKHEYLHFGEVEVFSGNTNIAFKKQTSLSSTHKPWGGPSSNAVDGNKKTWTHTLKGGWWIVDLGKSYNIEMIKIFNRQECCQNRLNGVLLEILNDSKKVIWSTRLDDRIGEQKIAVDTKAGFGGKGLIADIYHAYKVGDNWQLYQKTPTRVNYIKRVITPNIDYNWGSGKILNTDKTNNIGIRWYGWITPTKTGVYKFWTRHDDGGRLKIARNWYINSKKSWKSQNLSKYHGGPPIKLFKDYSYPIYFEWYEAGGNAAAELWWQPPGEVRVKVPSSVCTQTRMGPEGKFELSQNYLYGVGNDQKLYRQKNPGNKLGGWINYNQCCVDSIAHRNGYFYGVSNYSLMRMKVKGNYKTGWSKIVDTCCVRDIAFHSNGILYGVGVNGSILRKKTKNVKSNWVDVNRKERFTDIEPFRNNTKLRRIYVKMRTLRRQMAIPRSDYYKKIRVLRKIRRNISRRDYYKKIRQIRKEYQEAIRPVYKRLRHLYKKLRRINYARRRAYYARRRSRRRAYHARRRRRIAQRRALAKQIALARKRGLTARGNVKAITWYNDYLWAVSKRNRVMRQKAKNSASSGWNDYGSCCVKSITFDDNGVMYGVGKNNRIYRKSNANPRSRWKYLGNCCVKSIMFAPKGTERV